MEEFIIKYWVQVAFGIVLSGLGIIYRKLVKELESQKHIKSGIVALLHYRVYIEAEILAEKEEKITTEEFENLKYIYDPYLALGGNGVAKALFERVERKYKGQ